MKVFKSSLLTYNVGLFQGSLLPGERETLGMRLRSSKFFKDLELTGTNWQWRLVRGNITTTRTMSFAFEKTPLISLGCKLVPVQCREYKNGLLSLQFVVFANVLSSWYLIYSAQETGLEIHQEQFNN